MMVCTEPLPNERVPISVARLWSCSAPDSMNSTPLRSSTLVTRAGRLAQADAICLWALFGASLTARDSIFLPRLW